MDSNRLDNFKWPLQLQNHQLENTKMYASRESVLKIIPKSISYLELGVLAGDYTHEVISECLPIKVILVDTFDCEDSIFTQKPSRFNKEEQLDFVTNRFLDNSNVKIIKGPSAQVLKSLDSFFDYIYIDADHTYNAVVSDLEESVRLLNKGGIIGLNDYIMWDYLVDFQYGVVQAVNEFLSKNQNWEVAYYALSSSMFCDIYLREKC